MLTLAPDSSIAGATNGTATDRPLSVMALIRKLLMPLKPPSDPLIVSYPDGPASSTLTFAKFILGATGTGKSQLAVEIAKRFNGEIINGDAMQIYKGLPIITNKISEAERQGIPHHIFDQIGLDQQPWTVSNFQREAHKTIQEIRSRGRLPILVGGTHYYAEAVLFKGRLVAGEDAVAEGETEDTSQNFPILDASTPDILAKLREVDPEMANRWHPEDRRKIRRSLEIWLQTGKTATQTYKEQSQQRLKLQSTSAPNPCSLIFWLRADEPVLQTRLDHRLDHMLTSGLIQEALSIATYEHNLPPSHPPLDKTKGIWISIGYKELTPYLTALKQQQQQEEEPPNLPLLKSSCLTSIRTATRQYAHRQDTWIRTHLSALLLTSPHGLDTLYPLDSTDPSTWTASVSTPATDLVARFLAGQARPAPESISDMARCTLGRIRARAEEDGGNNGGSGGSGNSSSSQRACRHCDLCGKTLMTEKEWTAHLAGRTHRKVVAGRAKWEAFKAWQERQAQLQEE